MTSEDIVALLTVGGCILGVVGVVKVALSGRLGSGPRSPSLAREARHLVLADARSGHAVDQQRLPAALGVAQKMVAARALLVWSMPGLALLAVGMIIEEGQRIGWLIFWVTILLVNAVGALRLARDVRAGRAFLDRHGPGDDRTDRE